MSKTRKDELDEGFASIVSLVKQTRKEVTPDALWQRCIEGRLTADDRYLLATAVKRIATNPDIKTELVVFTETHYWDLDKKLSTQHF